MTRPLIDEKNGIPLIGDTIISARSVRAGSKAAWPATSTTARMLTRLRVHEGFEARDQGAQG